MSTHMHILPGPSVRKTTERYADLWCFGCRKHFLHRWVVFSYPPSSDFANYYEPIGRWECPQCGKDKTRFGSSS